MTHEEKKIGKIVEEMTMFFFALGAKNMESKIERVENVYKKVEKPSLTKDYPSLSERLEELFQLTTSEEKADYEELLAQIDLVKRSLKNYGVFYEDGKLMKK